MYDYIRLETKSPTYRLMLLSKPLLKDKFSGLNRDTGEIAGKIKIRFQGLTIELYPSGRVVIYGSLHKYMNNGEHNYNNFNYDDLLAVIQDLINKFGEEIVDMTVTSLEYGLNVTAPFNVKRFTERCVSYANQERSPIVKDDRKGYDKGVAFNMTDYRIKIYDKSKQYNLPLNILRVEIKYLRNRSFQQSQIKTLRDLVNPHAVNYLATDLLKKLEHTVYREDIDLARLPHRKQRIYQECINPTLWGSWDKVKRNRRLGLYAKLLAQYAKTNDKEMILDLLKTKHSQLINNQSSVNVFRGI